MEQMHDLLKLQIRRYFGEPNSLPKEWQGFIDAVNTAYFEFDASRVRLESAPELTSQLLAQLLETNEELHSTFHRPPVPSGSAGKKTR